MHGYKVTKNGKTVCLGVTDTVSDALNRLPSARYKVTETTKDKEGRKKIIYEAVGYAEHNRKNINIGSSGDRTTEIHYSDEIEDKWIMEVTHNVPDIIDILFEELQGIWNK